MPKHSQVKDELARRLQECLREAGVDAELEISAHEAIVQARVKADDGDLRVVAYISDREPKVADTGAAPHALRKLHVAAVAVRPTLAAQAAGRSERPFPVERK